MTQIDVIPDSESPESLISTRKKPRKNGVTIYRKNPFWSPIEIKVGTRKVTIAGGFTHTNDTGEGVHHAGIHRVEHVDETQFVKLFTQNVNIFFNLSAPSQKVFKVLLVELQKTPNADGIFLPWFSVEDFAIEHEMKISRSTYFRGLKEMIEKGFIAESENQNYYWINPNLFFNGDRMVFISEFRKIKKPGSKEKKAIEKPNPKEDLVTTEGQDGGGKSTITLQNQ